MKKKSIKSLEKKYLPILESDLGKNLSRVFHYNEAYIDFVNQYGPLEEIRKHILSDDLMSVQYLKYIVNKFNQVIIDDGGDQAFKEIQEFINNIYQNVLNDYSSETIPSHFLRFLQIKDNINDFSDTLNYLEELLSNREELMRQKMNGENNRKIKPTEKNIQEYLKGLSWVSGSKEFIRQMKLLRKEEIYFDNIDSVIMRDPDDIPYFKRGDECKAAASLFSFWQMENYIDGLYKNSKGRESTNVQIIIDNFNMNEKGRFLSIRALRDAFGRIKTDTRKIKVFSNLLKKK